MLGSGRKTATEIKIGTDREGVKTFMSDFGIFEREHEMEKWLQATYEEWWGRMIRAVESLDEQDVRKLSNPFLIKCLPAYRKAKRRVLIVGQETNGWGIFYETLEHFHHHNVQYERDNIIRYIHLKSFKLVGLAPHFRN